jgi:hypothetical protein
VARETAAQKKAREAAEAEAAQAAVPQAPEGGEAPEQSTPGVFVTKERDGEGNLNINIVPVGVEVTEVQTILEIGLKSFREQIGLGRQNGR